MATISQIFEYLLLLIIKSSFLDISSLVTEIVTITK